MNISKLNLTDEQQDWINGWLELWGAWVYSGRIEKRMSSVIAQYMATVEASRYPDRPMCNDDDGMLISQVVDSVMRIDKKALGILLSYYSHGSTEFFIAVYYHKTAKPRKISKRGIERFSKPSLSTCRREIKEILEASRFMLYQPLQNAFISRKRVDKVKHIASNVLTSLSY